jgi:hypothetical protein
MKKHYETHVEDTDKLISVAGPVLDYKSWYEQYRKLMEEQAQRKYGLYTPTSEGDDDDFPSITGMIARYSASGLTNEQMAANPVWVDKTGNGHDLQMKNFSWKEGSGISDVYLGALVFDGVDDYGVCDNFPVLTKEKGYTVVALRQYLFNTTDKIRSLVTNAPRSIVSRSTLTFELIGSTGKKMNFSFGKGNLVSDFEPNVFSYMTSKSYNGETITPGDVTESNERLLVGNFSEKWEYGSNVAIWELVFLDHDATEEELTKIKDYFVKTYPWLFPDQAWTVTGKTNEDEDRATIANITGNGNNLVLSNFGFIEGSGYNEEGEHAGYLVTDGVDDMITSSVFQMGKDFTIVGDWKFINNKKSGTGLVKGSSFYIYNTRIGLDLYINSGSVKNSLDGIKSINAACSDGRAYDRNWNEILANTGNVVGSGGILEVSSSGGRFDRMAFKNLAIYPRILSKDDCIKAYNYLQTLKAK